MIYTMIGSIACGKSEVITRLATQADLGKLPEGKAYLFLDEMGKLSHWAGPRDDEVPNEFKVMAANQRVMGRFVMRLLGEVDKHRRETNGEDLAESVVVGTDFPWTKTIQTKALECQVAFVALKIARYHFARSWLQKYGRDGVVFLEREPMEDRIFVKTQVRLGLISPDGMDCLEAVRGELFASVGEAPQRRIFLRCEPKVALKRLKVRGRREETNVTEEYLTDLQAGYDYEYRNAHLKLDTTNLTPDKVLETVHDFFLTQEGLLP